MKLQNTLRDPNTIHKEYTIAMNMTQIPIEVNNLKEYMY